MQEDLNPVRYEIFRRRLFHILEEGRLAIKMVSGSAVVVEGGETMCCFCNAGGEVTMVAAGILLHAIGASDFVLKAIELYEEDPGFSEGDQLFFNDPYIGGQHLGDQVIIKPIFYRGRRVAWVGSIMHTAETGGMQIGGSPALATEIFQEGFRIQGLKIVEKGRLRRDVYNTLLAQAWVPTLLALDTKAKIAANNTCERRYLELIDKFGLDFIEAASRKIIADSEALSREKLRSLPDGVWRSRLYGDTGGVIDTPYKVVCAMTKEEDRLTFDFTGSSPQNKGTFNCTLPATWGELFVVLCSQLFYDVPWNRGMFRPVEVIAPEGTVVNCRFPASCGRGVYTSGLLVQETAHECIAKMFYAGGLLTDINSAWQGGGGSRLAFGGVDQFGDLCGGMILDSFAGGIGATPFRDGVDTGAQMMNPQSSISDVEIIELNFPLMYLMRRNARDSGGFGAHAGGMAPESIYMIKDTRDFRVNLYRHAQKTPPNWGMFGGYPGAPLEGLLVLESSLPEWFTASRSPGGFEDMEELGGRIFNPPDRANIQQIAVRDYDLMFNRLNAGGGYGDPLDRDPGAVAADLERGAVSRRNAERIYGVVIDRDSGRVDERETSRRRGQIREERRQEGSVPCPSAIDRGRLAGVPAATVVRFHEYLEIARVAGGLTVRCVKCGHIFCDARDNYKKYALLRERDLGDVRLRSLISGAPIWVVYQEYCCPGCATLLEVDNFCPRLDSEEERILWDIQLRLPAAAGV